MLVSPGLCYGKGLLPADSMVGEVSHNVTFTIVNPPSTPFRVVAWTTNGTNVITSGGSGADDIGTGYVGRITLNSTTGSLELRNLVLSDTGEYVVTILAVGQPKEGTATLRVYGEYFVLLAKLTISPNPPIIEGGSVTLTCDASGSISNRDWRKDGQPLSPSERIIFSEDNKTVSISPLNLTDSGIFLCHLANLLSNENASYNLTVNCEYDTTYTVGQKNGNMAYSKCTVYAQSHRCMVLSLFFAVKGSTQGGPNVGAIVGGSLGAVAVVAVTELNYADITQFQKRDGGSVQLGNLGISSTEYATVRVNNRPVGVSQGD
uniref:Carcinoembryonic antigen-related cell adhesion molecule 1 n=1 Tax=Oncorhynchus kisutch TaxID=8019 RepID=A0A8C7ITU2_ONCKI